MQKLTKSHVLLPDNIASVKGPEVFNKKRRAGLLPLMQSLINRLQSDSLLRNSIYLMGSTIATSVIGYLYWVFATHMYSANDVGLASAFISAMTLTSTFANLGIGSALVQILPRRKSSYEWSLTLNMCIMIGALASLVAGIAVGIALPFLSPQFAMINDRPIYMLIFVAGVILCTVATLLDQVFVAERASDNMAMRNSAFAIFKLPLMILLVQVGTLGIFSSWVLSLLASAILAALVLIPRLKKNYCFATRGMMKQVRPMLSAFAGHHFINIGGSLPMYLLPVFVAVQLSATDNAYFYTTWMLGSLFFMVSSAVATALFSEGSHATRDVMRKVRSSSVIIGILLAPILLVFFLSGHLILSVFGPSYSEHGFTLLMLLMISAVPDAITNIYVSLLRVRGRLVFAGFLNLGMAGLGLVLAWLLLPKLGIAGAGWAWLIAQSSGSLVVGVDSLISRSNTSESTSPSTRVSLLQRLTLHNIAGFYRYVLLRLRFRNLHVGLFFIDKDGQIEVGPKAHLRFGHGIRFMRNFTGHFYGEVALGDDIFFNRGCYVAAYSKLTIGNYCLFGEGVSIHDENHVIGCGPEPIASRGFVAKPITIGNNVWVGAKATILSGICIGDNAVIGANAVVTRDVPANTIVGGIPARILREIKPTPSPLPIQQDHDITSSIWLVDTIKHLAVTLPLLEQNYKTSISGEQSLLHYEASSRKNTDGKTNSLKPSHQQHITNLINSPTISPSAINPFLKRVHLQEMDTSTKADSKVK